MGEWSFPFQSSNGDRAYSDADFAQYYANFFTTGIIATIGTALQVKQTAQPSMNIVLGMGAANIKGRHYLNTSEKNFVIPVPSTTQERTDSIVIRLSLTDRTILSVYKENSTQVVQTDDIFELQLCTIKVPANATSISQANITDKRSDKNVCGFSTPFAELNVGDLMAQYEAQVQEWFDQAQVNVNNLIQNYDQQFQDWFKNLKDQLDDNQAANLQNQIDAINGVIVQKNIPDGANLDEYKAEGEFSKKTPTVVTGAPEGVTGAFRLFVRTMLGSSGIFQTLYDYATRSMYYRIGNTTLGFNLPWKKVATTDDIKELTAGDIGWTTLGTGSRYKKSANRVTVDFHYIPATNANFNLGTLPEGCRPTTNLMFVVAAWKGDPAGNNHLQINDNGAVTLLATMAQQQYHFQVSFEI